MLSYTNWSLSDATRIVADSVKAGKPIIVVSIHYRLNIFAFGDGKHDTNLALKDQKLAIEWVQKYIGGFGGDPVRLSSLSSKDGIEH
jgi:carboxylesterase type B